ncbi:hypothetical protein BY996DRAFT_7052631 [Phakopsora pachyrhizi]|nr:hypothetical protein BY996DRAFT_7052631 [Phakopsora pachyrhizi]
MYRADEHQRVDLIPASSTGSDSLQGSSSSSASSLTPSSGQSASTSNVKVGLSSSPQQATVPSSTPTANIPVASPNNSINPNVTSPLSNSSSERGRNLTLSSSLPSQTAGSSIVKNLSQNISTPSISPSPKTISGEKGTSSALIGVVSVVAIGIVLSALIFLLNMIRLRKKKRAAAAFSSEITDDNPSVKSWTFTRNRSASNASSSASSNQPLNTRSIITIKKRTDSIASFGPGPSQELLPENSEVKNEAFITPWKPLRPYRHQKMNSTESFFCNGHAENPYNAIEVRSKFQEEISHIPITYQAKQSKPIFSSYLPSERFELSAQKNNSFSKQYPQLKTKDVEGRSSSITEDYPETPTSAFLGIRKSVWDIDQYGRASNCYDNIDPCFGDLNKCSVAAAPKNKISPAQTSRESKFSPNDPTYPTNYSYYKIN